MVLGIRALRMNSQKAQAAFLSLLSITYRDSVRVRCNADCWELQRGADWGSMCSVIHSVTVVLGQLGLLYHGPTAVG